MLTMCGFTRDTRTLPPLPYMIKEIKLFSIPIRSYLYFKPSPKYFHEWAQYSIYNMFKHLLKSKLQTFQAILKKNLWLWSFMCSGSLSCRETPLPLFYQFSSLSCRPSWLGFPQYSPIPLSSRLDRHRQPRSFVATFWLLRLHLNSSHSDVF